jgi:hypothetical protein
MGDKMRPNRVTEEGRELGRHLARLCDSALARKEDARCGTCAFRAGDHLANGSSETLMTALKCAMEREPFWCHEHNRPCAGWAAMRFPTDRKVAAPWDYAPGGEYNAGDVIPMPDETGGRDG